MLSHMLRAIQKEAASIISFIGYNDGENATLGTVTINAPTGSQVGDLLVAFGYSATAGTEWTASGTGWTITNALNTTAPRLTAFYKIHDGSTSYTFTNIPDTADIGVTLMTFRNASIDVVSTLATAADPIVIPAVTVTNNKSLQLITAGGNINEPASTPSGFTQITLNTAGNQPDWGVYYKSNITSGSTGTVSVDMTASANTSGMQVVLKEKPAITFVGVAEQAIGSNTGFTATYPSGTQDGDLAFICVSATNNLGSGYSATGWTSLNVTTSPTGIKSQILYRVVSGTGNQTFSSSSGTITNSSYLLTVFRNATYSNIATATGSASVVNPPQRTGLFNAVVCFGNINAADTAISPPTGYTTLGEIPSTSITTCGGYLLTATLDPDPGTFNGVSSSNWIAYTIGLI